MKCKLCEQTIEGYQVELHRLELQDVSPTPDHHQHGDRQKSHPQQQPSLPAKGQRRATAEGGTVTDARWHTDDRTGDMPRHHAGQGSFHARDHDHDVGRAQDIDVG